MLMKRLKMAMERLRRRFDFGAMKKEREQAERPDRAKRPRKRRGRH